MSNDSMPSILELLKGIVPEFKNRRAIDDITFEDLEMFKNRLEREKDNLSYLKDNLLYLSNLLKGGTSEFRNNGSIDDITSEKEKMSSIFELLKSSIPEFKNKKAIDDITFEDLEAAKQVTKRRSLINQVRDYFRSRKDPYVAHVARAYPDDPILDVIRKDFNTIEKVCTDLSKLDMSRVGWKSCSDLLVVLQRFIEFYPRMDRLGRGVTVEMVKALEKEDWYRRIIKLFEQERRIEIERVKLFESSFDPSRHLSVPGNIELHSKALTSYFKPKDIAAWDGLIFEVTKVGYRNVETEELQESAVVLVSGK